MRTAWQEHIGVGERQPKAIIVGNTHRVYVEHEDGGIAGTQVYHSGSDRVDAHVRARTIKMGKRSGHQVLREARVANGRS